MVTKAMFLAVGEGSFKSEKGEKEDEPHGVGLELELLVCTQGFLYITI